MKTLYIECNMGASGDMLQGALVDLLGCRSDFVSKMNSLGFDNVKVKCERKEKCGITGEKVSVLISGAEESEHHHHDHERHEHHEHYELHEHHHHHHHHHHHDYEHHHHNSLTYIEDIIEKLDVSEKVKKDAKAVFQIVASAESQVHGKPISDIHFHEVGSLDAVCDIVGFSILMEMLNPDRVIVSPINTGKGTVNCAHGILPVPAPATALILRDIPCYSNEISGELCTPTGAALLKYFASDFAERGVMTISKIGYGLGTKDFEAANVVRAFLSEGEDDLTDTVIKLDANIDDMTAEDLAYAQKLILEEGALEVFTIPAMMKKSRQGIVLSCLCKFEDKDRILKVIFDNTSTIGIRESVEKRYILSRRFEKFDSSLGEVVVKISEGYGTRKHKIEHDCLEELAKGHGLSVNDVRLRLEKELEF